LYAYRIERKNIQQEAEDKLHLKTNGYVLCAQVTREFLKKQGL